MLPRFILSHNEEFFNILFNLQDLNDNIAIEAFEFVSLIATNPHIYKQILFAASTNEETKDNQFDWKLVLDDTNIYK